MKLFSARRSLTAFFSHEIQIYRKWLFPHRADAKFHNSQAKFSYCGRVCKATSILIGILASAVVIHVSSLLSGKFPALIDIAFGNHNGAPLFTDSQDSTLSNVTEKDYEKNQKTIAMGHQFSKYTLGEVIPLTKDVALFRFLLPHPEHVLLLEPCINIEARFYYNGKLGQAVTRHYTPIVSTTAKGYFDILVRRRTNGMMTEYLFGLVPGDHLEFRLATRQLKYRVNKWKEVGMICGGSGITPMLQILRYALNKENDDETKFNLIYCNRSEENIPLKSYLDTLAALFPKKLLVTYGVDKAKYPDLWQGFIGHVDRKTLRKRMPIPSKDNILLICGPDGFVERLTGAKRNLSAFQSKKTYKQPLYDRANRVESMDGVLHSMGYLPENIFVF